MPTPTTSEEIDRELAVRALAKRRRSQIPTRDELAALRRMEKIQENKWRWEYYRTVPKGHYLEMSGRQARTLNAQALSYGIPCGGRVVDLSAVIRWLHDFLAFLGSRGHDAVRQDWRKQQCQLARPKPKEQLLVPKLTKCAICPAYFLTLRKNRRCCSERCRAKAQVDAQAKAERIHRRERFFMEFQKLEQDIQTRIERRKVDE